MPAAIADHLWQSGLCLVALALLALLFRRQSARLRLWLWRIAALKFLVPFALLYSAGKWLGFPVSDAADPAPAFLVDLFAGLEPLLAPAQFAALGAAASSAIALLLSQKPTSLSLQRYARFRQHVAGRACRV